MSSKKIRTGHLSLDPYENAIVVNYEVEITDHSTGQTETTQKETKVRLKTIKVDTNLSKLAKDIVNKSKYISEKKLPLVSQLVYDLQQRQFQDDDMDFDNKNEMEAPTMDKIDEYMEMLYGGEDEVAEKIKGCTQILQLCKFVGNLEVLIQNMQLMSALSRVLNDDYKRSMELSYKLCSIFLALSNFMEMHTILSNYRVGAMTMKVVELELKRSLHREEERTRGSKENSEPGREGSNNKHTTNGATQLVEESPKDRALSRRQDRLLFVALHVLINLAEDVSVERKMVKRELVQMLSQLLNRRTPDTLLLILAFLKKLSIFEENKSLMCQPDVGMIYNLAAFLPTSHNQVTTSALRLLFNLSFSKECRQAMIAVGMIPKLVDMLKKAPFRAKTIRLLYHLSADATTCAIFANTDIVPIIMQLIINFPQKIIAKELAALAINVSLDPDCAEQFTEHRGISHLLSRVDEYGDVLLAKVIRNISQWTFGEQRKIAKIEEHVEMLKKDRIKQREIRNNIDNFSRREEGKNGDRGDEEDEDNGMIEMDLPKIPGYAQKRLWSSDIQNIIKMALDCDSHDLLVELLGILGNITNSDMPKGKNWGTMMTDYNLCNFVSKLLVPGMSQNDVVLETVILIGQFVHDEEGQMLIASSSLIRALHELWQDKGDDSEILLQLLAVFHKMLHWPDCREELLYSTEAISDICECVNKNHTATRYLAEKCLDRVMEHDRSETGELGELGAQVRRRRFLAHNREWIEEVVRDDVHSNHHHNHHHTGDRVYRHSSDDLLDDDDHDNNQHFVTGSGQKLQMNTSQLSSGVDDSGGSRDWEGWGN